MAWNDVEFGGSWATAATAQAWERGLASRLSKPTNAVRARSKDGGAHDQKSTGANLQHRVHREVEPARVGRSRTDGEQRAAALRRALVALIGGLANGFVPNWLFHRPEDSITIAWLFAMVAVFGHCYTPWLRSRGGQGVAPPAGAMLAMYPGVAALSLAFVVPVRVLGRRFRIGEIGTWASLLT